MKIIRLILLGFLLAAQVDASRGVQREVKNPKGKTIVRYGDSYALLIGAGRYTNGWPVLDTVHDELDRIQKALETRDFKVTRVDDPDSDALGAAFRRFIKRYGFDASNRLLIYYSSHGYSTQEYGYLVPVDAPLPENGLANFRRYAYNMSELKGVISRMGRNDARHVLFLFDSCFSGKIFNTRGVGDKLPPYIMDSMARPVRQVITAGNANEEVPAKSTFAPMFLAAIAGKADANRDGYVTGQELGLYLRQNLPGWTKQHPQLGVLGEYDLNEGDFIFFSPDHASPQPPSIQSPVKPSTFRFESLRPDTFALTVTPEPKDATVYITNIGPKYHDGIALAPGKYDIKVVREGYYPKRGTVNLQSDTTVPVTLEKIPVAAVTPHAMPTDQSKKDHGTSIEPAMTYIKPGSFQIGSNNGDSDEKPVHTVTIQKGFYLGKTEVTFAEYDRYCEATGKSKPSDRGWGRGNRPVIYVSWNDSTDYAKWLSQKVVGRAW